MNETTAVEMTTIPSQESGGFSVQTVGIDGAPISKQAQFQELLKNPTFREQALTVGTPAAAWVDRMNREAAGVAPLAQPIGPGPSTLAPESFTIPYPHGFEGSPEQAVADTVLRGFLVASGVDRETGDSLASLAAERIAHWETVGDRSNSAAEAEAILRDVYREEYEPRIAAAKRYADHIERQQPGFGQFLTHTGLGNDATFIHRLATIAEQRGI